MRQMAAMQRRFLDIARREQRERRQQQHEEDRDEEDDGFGEDMAADPGEELSEAGPSIPVPLPKVSVSVVCDNKCFLSFKYSTGTRCVYSVRYKVLRS